MKIIKSTFAATGVAFAMSMPSADAVSLELLQDQVPGSYASWEHPASGGERVITSTTTGNTYLYYANGRTTKRSLSASGGGLSADHTAGTALFENWSGIINVGTLDESIKLVGGSADFANPSYGGDDLYGTINYERYSEADGGGTVIDTGTYYIYSFLFGTGPNSPNSFYEGEIHVWANNLPADEVYEARQILDDTGSSAAAKAEAKAKLDGLRGFDLALRVPDGGFSVLLLGIGISGLGFFQLMTKRKS